MVCNTRILRTLLSAVKILDLDRANERARERLDYTCCKSTMTTECARCCCLVGSETATGWSLTISAEPGQKGLVARHPNTMIYMHVT